MFQKVFEYAGPHKKGLYAATAIVLVSVLMGVLPFVLAYQVIAPLVIDNGQIAQQGTHEELLKQPGIYQDFVNIRKSAAGWSLA